MRDSIILHGMPSRERYLNAGFPSPSNNHWLPWLQHELLIGGILAQTPELPRPFAPTYDAWRAAFERLEPGEETILVGHSLGAGFLLRWLSEQPVQVGTVALVAPWLGDDPDADGFSPADFTIDPQFPQRTSGVHVFVSSDDEDEILATAQPIRERVPEVTWHEFTDRRHFRLEDLGTHAFPELLAVLP